MNVYSNPPKNGTKKQFQQRQRTCLWNQFFILPLKVIVLVHLLLKVTGKNKKIEHFSNVKDFASGPFSKVSVLVYLLFKVSIDSSFENTPGPQDREECQYSSEFFCSWNSLLILITAERSLQWRFNFFLWFNFLKSLSPCFWEYPWTVAAIALDQGRSNRSKVRVLVLWLYI